MQISFQRWAAGLALIGFSYGCAHAPLEKAEDPQKLIVQACAPGSLVKSVKGSAWMKLQSKEVSGQFPANVISQGPEDLRLEVTNLLGGTEAVITVQGRHYEVNVPSKKKGTKAQKEEGSGSWGGIPLQWATDLFLGRIPCPAATVLSGSKISVGDSGDLTVETPASLEHEVEKYVYHFRKWEGTPWPESLHWERQGAFANAVDFKFDDPEDKTRSPKKWEAKSSRGEVKVRWKDRDIAH